MHLYRCIECLHTGPGHWDKHNGRQNLEGYATATGVIAEHWRLNPGHKRTTTRTEQQVHCCMQLPLPPLAGNSAGSSAQESEAARFAEEGYHELSRARRGGVCVLCDRAELQRIEDIGDEDMDLSLLPPPVL